MATESKTALAGVMMDGSSSARLGQSMATLSVERMVIWVGQWVVFFRFWFDWGGRRRLKLVGLLWRACSGQ